MISAQELNTHLWQDRVVLILQEEGNWTEVNLQKKMLLESSEELTERKLVIYQVSPIGCALLHGEGIQDLNYKAIFDKYKRGNSAFEIVLIGLDGGVKFRESKPVKRKVLFSLIDGMPMRRRELRN